jgi:hypothetical protein
MIFFTNHLLLIHLRFRADGTGIDGCVNMQFERIHCMPNLHTLNGKTTIEYVNENGIVKRTVAVSVLFAGVVRLTIVEPVLLGDDAGVDVP